MWNITHAVLTSLSISKIFIHKGSQYLEQIPNFDLNLIREEMVLILLSQLDPA